MLPDRRLGAILCCVAPLLGGCAADRAPVPVAEVRLEPFEIRIPAFGELAAARTTPIEIPPTLRGIQRIAWLAPDGALVEDGALVARLDSDRIDQKLDQLRREVRKIDFRLEAKEQELVKERQEIESHLALLAQEHEDALATAPRDERLFSRQEIIDAQINIELIETKMAHFETRLGRLEAKQKNELEILNHERETEQVQIDQLEQARRQLEIHAPHAGFFLRGSTWQGEKMRIGMELWGGQTLGELPDLSQMEAKVWVLEAEAAGLVKGLGTRVTLDAHPGLEVGGRVKTIEPIANPIEPESPVKYFEVVLALDGTAVDVMKPASQVHVTILVLEEASALTVPNQAIFVEGGQPWVYVELGRGFERRRVELGQRSVSRTVIAQGLEPGERIALVEPEGAAEKGA